MTKTNKEVIDFINAGVGYMKTHEKIDGKFKYALRKVLKACAKVYEDYSALIEDLRIEHCSVDAKTSTILKDERGGYQFTKESMRAFITASKALLATSVEVTPFIAKDIPDDLTDDDLDAFSGFVLPEVDDEGASA